MKIKNYMFITILILFSTYNLSSQNQCGIYLSADDFTNKKVSHSGKGTKIKTHENFHKDIVEVRCSDTTLSFKKKDVFGYCDKNGQCYRFFSGEIYPIINPGETILLYKRTFGSGLKNDPEREVYYFSKDASSPITDLTLRNIESAFADNAPFLKLIEVHFNDDSNLLEYDNIHKVYKLNRLLELANKRNN